MNVLVIIPAAGSGTRFGGGIPKQFQSLAGRPILQHVVERFLLSGPVTHVIVPVAPELAGVVKPMERVQFVPGGATRQESVTRGLEQVTDAFDLVAVHDAVRPFFRTATFLALLEAAAESGAAIPALPVTETIHSVAGGKIVDTASRETLFAAQTPQCFRFEVLRDSLKRAQQDGFAGTDEAGLAARYGHVVRVLPGDPNNIKITRPDDLALAEARYEEWSAE